MAVGLQRNGLTHKAGDVAEQGTVHQGSHKKPREQADVGHTVDELLGPGGHGKC